MFLRGQFGTIKRSELLFFVESRCPMEQVIPYILLACAVLLETAKTVFSNNFSKRVLTTETDIYKFNTFMYLGSFLVLCCCGKSPVSVFTCITAFLFAVCIWLNQYCFLKALKIGPMSFVTFIQGTSLLVPIVYGVFMWKERITLWQVIWLVVLLIGMALSLDLRREKGNGKWILFAFGAMLFMGGIGILQTTHQTSVHRGELISFLRLAFLFTVGINFIGWRIGERKVPACFKMKSSATPMAAASGVCMGVVHIFSLYLSGVLPKVVFFPVANGGLIFITMIAALIFFKERFSVKQWIGFFIGTIALSVIGL